MVRNVTAQQVWECFAEAGLSGLVISQAVRRATLAHGRQVRDDGGSYLESHIFPVAVSLTRRFRFVSDLERLVVVGLLHDTLEDDSSYTFAECVSEFGEEVAEALDVLTKPSYANRGSASEQEKFAHNRVYLRRVYSASDLVKRVKLEDRLNNLASIQSLLRPEKYERYLVETTELFLPLAQEVGGGYPQDYQDEIERVTQLFRPRIY